MDYLNVITNLEALLSLFNMINGLIVAFSLFRI